MANLAQRSLRRLSMFELDATLLPDSHGPHVDHVDEVARLWAGFGYICRITFTQQSGLAPCILKYVSPPRLTASERRDEGTVRKLASYKVEANFYEHLSSRFNTTMGPLRQVPEFVARTSSSGLLMADLALTHPTLPSSRSSLDLAQTLAAIDWFAAFHATYWGFKAEDGRDCEMPTKLMARADGPDSWKGTGVWKIGTYNYLQTRLKELEYIDKTGPFAELRGTLAFAVESALQDRTQPGMTLVHGDAKSANMAFAKVDVSRTDNVDSHDEGDAASWDVLCEQWSVSAFDFQYIGAGVGSQDLIKLLATAVDEDMLTVDEGEGERRLLDFYHRRLMRHLTSLGHVDAAAAFPRSALEAQWELSLVSWLRFTQGWGAWGNVDWLEDRGKQILSRPGWKQHLLSTHDERQLE
ncbi:unnamed protein product [Parajaminaea phylloscopi]